ncbi:MAG: hypothetical protein JWO19_5593 [Bryobacterales bacterium]|nr:hypothetical protein [Bryobacterales bacterium]
MLAVACSSQSADPKALPSWVGIYPGSHAQGSGSDFVFQTKDPAEKVLDFYQQQLTQNGLHMDQRGGGEYGGLLSAEDDSHRRSVVINIRSDKGTSEVSITPVEKK